MGDDGISYAHRQTGWVIIVALTIAAVGVFFATGERPRVGLVLAISFGILLALFHSMTVRVDRGQVRIAFGLGLVRTHIPLDRVRGCRVARNPWYYGWGIHWFPGGVLYNVSGMEAVELDLDNGRRFRVGTDEPDRLEAAITAALGRRQPSDILH